MILPGLCNSFWPEVAWLRSFSTVSGCMYLNDCLFVQNFPLALVGGWPGDLRTILGTGFGSIRSKADSSIKPERTSVIFMIGYDRMSGLDRLRRGV